MESTQQRIATTQTCNTVGRLCLNRELDVSTVVHPSALAVNRSRNLEWPLGKPVQGRTFVPFVIIGHP